MVQEDSIADGVGELDAGLIGQPVAEFVVVIEDAGDLAVDEERERPGGEAERLEAQRIRVLDLDPHHLAVHHARVGFRRLLGRPADPLADLPPARDLAAPNVAGETARRLVALDDVEPQPAILGIVAPVGVDRHFAAQDRRVARDLRRVLRIDDVEPHGIGQPLLGDALDVPLHDHQIGDREVLNSETSTLLCDRWEREL